MMWTRALYARLIASLRGGNSPSELAKRDELHRSMRGTAFLDSRISKDAALLRPGEMARLRDPAFRRSNSYLTQMHVADWDGVSPQIAVFAATFILELRKRDIFMFTHCAKRSAAEQTRLMRSGRSKLSGDNAPHPRGYAVDIVHSTMPWNLTDQEYLILGRIGFDVARRLGIHVEWGGHFGLTPEEVRAGNKRGWDPVHWQLVDWRLRDPVVGAGVAVRLTPHGVIGKYGKHVSSD